MILWFIVNVFTSVSFQCCFGSYIYWTFSSFLRSTCGLWGVSIKLEWDWTRKWPQMKSCTCVLEHMGILLHDVMSLKLNKIPKMHLSCRHLARVGTGEYLQCSFLVKLFFPPVTSKNLNKQQPLAVTVDQMSSKKWKEIAQELLFSNVYVKEICPDLSSSWTYFELYYWKALKCFQWDFPQCEGRWLVLKGALLALTLQWVGFACLF